MMHKFKYNYHFGRKLYLHVLPSFSIEPPLRTCPKRANFWKEIKRKGKRPPPFFQQLLFCLSFLSNPPYCSANPPPPCLAHYPPQWVLQIPPLEIGKENLKRKKTTAFSLNFSSSIVLSTAQSATKSPYLVSKWAPKGKAPPPLFPHWQMHTGASNFIMFAYHAPHR